MVLMGKIPFFLFIYFQSVFLKLFPTTGANVEFYMIYFHFCLASVGNKKLWNGPSCNFLVEQPLKDRQEKFICKWNFVRKLSQRDPIYVQDPSAAAVVSDEKNRLVPAIKTMINNMNEEQFFQMMVYTGTVGKELMAADKAAANTTAVNPIDDHNQIQQHHDHQHHDHHHQQQQQQQLEQMREIKQMKVMILQHQQQENQQHQ